MPDESTEKSLLPFGTDASRIFSALLLVPQTSLGNTFSRTHIPIPALPLTEKGNKILPQRHQLNGNALVKSEKQQIC